MYLATRDHKKLVQLFFILFAHLTMFIGKCLLVQVSCSRPQIMFFSGTAVCAHRMCV